MSINEELTFEFRDEYNRKPIAEKIIRLVESGVDISPLIIDGGWGTGKSEFCHKLINLLVSENSTNLRPVYIDAFKADHADEPLMTLLASVLKLLPEVEQKDLIDKALPAIRFGTKTILKGAVSWVLKQDATDVADDFEDVLKEAGDDVINHSIETLLSDHVKADESISALRTALIELAQDSPIVVFVDELDRCRPDFAISMLESIKHIFDVEGVSFVLVMNSNQLRASVNHCYGVGVNAQRYLDKFIGYRFKMSNIKDEAAHRLTHISEEHFLTLVRESELLVTSSVKLENTGVHRFVFEIISINNLSLREVETFIQYLEIYQVLTDSNGLNDSDFGYNLLSILGVFLYCFRQEVFNPHTSSVNIDNVLSFLGKKNIINKDLETSRVSPLDAVLVLLMRDDLSKNTNSSFKDDADTFSNWEKIITDLFRNGYGYEDNAINVLVKVGTVLSLK